MIRMLSTLFSSLATQGFGNMDIEALIQKYAPDIFIKAVEKDEKFRSFIEYIVRDEIQKKITEVKPDVRYNQKTPI